MVKKTVKFNQEGINKFPNDKPVLYKILSPGNKTNYAGVAKKGRVQERLQEHLPKNKDPIPGAKVKIEQMNSIKDAEKKETGVISRTRPKHNVKGK